MEDLRSGKPPEIADLLAAKRGTAEGVFAHFGEDADLIVGLGNGEPATVLDAIEARGEQLSGATVHQMLPLRGSQEARGTLGAALRRVRRSRGAGCAYRGQQADPPQQDHHHHGPRKPAPLLLR